jgi:hypothetical protein
VTDIFSIIKDYAQTITAGGVIAALLISFFSFISQRRHNNYERPVEVYKMINDFEQREARKSVYTAFRIYMERYYNDRLKIGGKTYFASKLPECKGKVFLDVFRDTEVLREMQLKENELQQDVESVRATFDHIGALCNQRHTKKAIVRSPLGTGRICWICLAQNIFIERDKRETEFYMTNFQDFFDEIEKYRDKHKPKLPPVEP